MKCEHCGAERKLYYPCPKCGRPTFKDRRDRRAEIENLLTDLDEFRAECDGAEYTDTGEAWRMIDRLEEALRGMT